MQAHVAAHAIQRVDGGWSWQFDPTILHGRASSVIADDELRAVGNRVDIVRGEHSRVLPAERAARVAALLPHARGPIVVPDAHHHLMLDSPLALVALLRALLA